VDIGVGAFADLPSDENLMGYWSFDDGTGTVAVDGSGNGNDGTLIGNPVWTDGICGTCYEGDGTGDCVSIPNSTDFQMGTDDFSVSLWVYVDSGIAITEAWLLSIITGGLYAFSIYPINGAKRIYTYLSDGTNSASGYTGNSSLNLDQWNHIVVVWSRTDDKTYAYLNGEYDGSLDNSAVTGNVNPTGVLYLGADGNGNNSLYGKLDEVRIYNRALTPSEVKALYLYPAGNRGTRISGNRIRTGIIQSDNYAASAGSMLNLNDGTFKLGGSSTPEFEFHLSLAVPALLSLNLTAAICMLGCRLESM